MVESRGYAALDKNSALKPFSFSRSEAKDEDVLIEIQYCGICHSDIHMARNEWGFSLYPMVPGHEIVGIVSAVGKAVTRFKKGDRVGVGCFIDSCGQCAACVDHQEQLCEKGMIMTYGSDLGNGKLSQGGYSNNIVVNENYVLRLPANLSMAATAPLLCAGITLYSPLMQWQAGPGKKVAIVGLGGLGHMGIKLARAMGAEVTVLSHSSRKEADSLRLGAHHFYSTAKPEVFEDLKGHFDLIINTVSAQINWNLYLGLLRRDGAMVMVGLPEHEIPIDAKALVFGRKRLAGSLIGGIKETQEMLDFCGKNEITADIELVKPQEINQAFERVLKSDVRYRFVIDMKEL